MTRRVGRLAWRTAAAITLIAVLVAAGFAVHQLGWSHGYTAAQLAARGEDAPLPPLAPEGWRPVGIQVEAS